MAKSNDVEALGGVLVCKLMSSPTIDEERLMHNVHIIEERMFLLQILPAERAGK